MKFTLYGKTDVGSVRDHNEDNFAVCSDILEKAWTFSKDEPRSLSVKGALMIVADGMGGTNAGEVASDIAQFSIKEAFDALTDIPTSDKDREQLLKKLIVQAHKDIVKHQESNLETAGMGTTLVIAWIINDTLHVAWSGDSRCYVLDTNQALKPFTDDHSVVWDLVKSGDLTPEEARTHPNSNIINQSLGDNNLAPKPDAKSRPLYAGNKVLVCSDGLNGMISDEHLETILRKEQSLSETCSELIAEANKAGGHDNITCLLLEVTEGAAAQAGQTFGEEKPSTGNSAKLRKKVKLSYYVIGALIIALAYLAYQTFGITKSEVNRVPSETLLVDLNADWIIDLALYEPENNVRIEHIQWGNNPHQLTGNTIKLLGPISVNDTLFVSYSVIETGDKILRSFIFRNDPSLGDEAVQSDHQESKTPLESAEPIRPTAPPTAGSPPAQPQQPKADSTRRETPKEAPRDAPAPRPRLSPITIPIDTTK